MVEAFIPVGVAAATGFGVLMSRLQSRIHELDRRVDGVELRIAEQYLTKAEFSSVLERVESHMVRIENKLDTLASLRK
tara:strand:- start:1232 stop:1465 length:234 start_codon:yes stop_codon:yes gene_type:complete